MTRRQYIAELTKRLRRLPVDEVRNAVEYYQEYFEEAGPEKEQEAIRELGSPAQVSSKIIANFALKGGGEDRSHRKILSRGWLVLLAIFASPIALPLAMLLVLVVLALALALAALIVAVGRPAWAWR